MRAAVLALALAAPPALGIEVRSPEGELFAFPTLRDDRGTPIATSALRQWFEGGRLHVRVEHALHDGRRAVERATFTQGKELAQRTWSWEERRGREIVRAFAVDLDARRATGRKREGREEKTWDEEVKVEEGRTFVGVGVIYAAKNLRDEVVGGRDVKLRTIAFLPRPVSLPIVVKRGGRERVRVGGREVDSDRLEVRPDLKGLEELVEKVKDPLGADVWLHHGVPPMILRVRGPLAEARDPAVVLETLGSPTPAPGHAPGGAHGPGHEGEHGAGPAEHAHAAHRAGPLGIAPSREGSGTSWLPDSAPMYMLEARRGGWSLGLMGNVFAQWIDERGARGDDQLGSVNWVMGMAGRELGGGELRARAMLSAEPLTIGRCGYPDLLATGELCRGAPIHDRQHPHDLFMELSAGYRRALGQRLALELYAAPAGEPALGPTAFPHRPSAMPSPIAPITHHWLDSTHISFGVATAGLYGRSWKIEGSAFNGREPDDRRLGLDLDRLDSFSSRLWFLPDERWALQLSAGRLTDAEQDPAGGERADVDRLTASATLGFPLRGEGDWATTAAWGRNSERDHATHALLVESALSLRQRHVLFARVEVVQKTGEELAVPGAPPEAERWLAKLAATYVRQTELRVGASGILLGVGVGGSVSRVPAAFERAYGGRWPSGLVVFVNAHPAPMPR